MDYELDEVNFPSGDILHPRNVKVEVLFILIQLQ